MKEIQIAAPYLEQLLSEGYSNPGFKIIKGLTPDMKLIGARFVRETRILELWFDECEEVTQVQLQVEENPKNG